MSERLKRRKKPADGNTKESSKAPAPEPLQPRFYDDEPAAPHKVAPAAPSPTPAPAKARNPSRAEALPAAESAAEPAVPAAAGAPRPRISRRRPGRGGRGGNRSRTGRAAPAVA